MMMTSMKSLLALTVDMVLYPPHHLSLHLNQVVDVYEHAVDLSDGSLKLEKICMSAFQGC